MFLQLIWCSALLLHCSSAPQSGQIHLSGFSGKRVGSLLFKAVFCCGVIASYCSWVGGCCSALLTLLPALLLFFASSNCCGVWVHYLSCSTSLTSYSRIWWLTVACSIVPYPEVVLTSAASPVSILISEIELTYSDSFLSMVGLIDLSQTAKGFSTTIYKSTM